MPVPDKTEEQRLTTSLPDWQKWRPETPTTHRFLIGLLAGEGVGPELIPACVQVLNAIERCTPYEFEFRHGGPIGKSAMDSFGTALSPEVIAWSKAIFRDGGAILCGPAGSRFVYDMRVEFDLFCKFTPIQPISALNDTGVIKPSAREDVDLILVRENISGDYYGEFSNEADAHGNERIRHSFFYGAGEIRRILKVAVQLAECRRGRLCLVIKSDGIPAISKLWSDLFHELATETTLDTTVLEIDNAVYQIIASARNFDVIVSPNLFGDILADNASLLLGSRGMSFSGNFGKPGVATYQTGHGAAYDIAGKNIANPIGQILTTAMLLRESFGLTDIATVIEESVKQVVAAGLRTADIAHPEATIAGTNEMANRIAETVETRLLPASDPGQMIDEWAQQAG